MDSVTDTYNIHACNELAPLSHHLHGAVLNLIV